MYTILEHVFHVVVGYAIMVLEVVGVVIILVAACKSLMKLLKGQEEYRIEMAEGIATALTFLLGGEAMKTIVAPDWHDLGMTCAILLMRAAMSMLIHWETKNERAAMQAPGDAREAKTGGAELGK